MSELPLSDTILARLRWRYATKKFDPAKRITDAEWKVLEQSLVLSPSSYGLQLWKFFLVVDPALKSQLPVFSWGQPQPADCSHFVVLAQRVSFGPGDVNRLIEATAAIRGIPRESLDGLEGLMAEHASRANAEGWASTWMAKQVYVALGILMTTAAILGIDSCPMEGIDAAGYDRLLGLEAMGYTTTVACALGHRAADDKYASLAKVRFPTDEVVAIL